MIEQLHPDEQRAMLELLIYMAKADGEIADVETQILEDYALFTGIDSDTLDGNYQPQALVARLHSPRSRFIVLQELLRLAHIDGYFADDEQQAILEIAEMMGVPLGFLQEIENWVVEGMRWVWRGEELMELADVRLQPHVEDDDYEDGGGDDGDNDED